MLRRGQVYWASTFEGKRTPVLLLSPDARNQRANDVIVVPLSTRLRWGPWHVHLAKGEGGAPAPSIVKCEQITTLPKTYLDNRPLGGPLSPRRLAQVERAVLIAIGVAIP